MSNIVKLYSMKTGEIKRFLEHFNHGYADRYCLEQTLTYENPVEMADIIGAYVENIEDFSFTMWISLDENVLILITKNNADEIIRYLYERYPY